MPRISSRIWRMALAEAVELVLQPLELGGRCSGGWGLGTWGWGHHTLRFLRPPPQDSHQEHGRNDDRERRHEIAGEIEAAPRRRHQHGFTVLRDERVDDLLIAVPLLRQF